MLYSTEFNIATKMPWISQLIGTLRVCVSVCMCVHVWTHTRAPMCTHTELLTCVQLFATPMDYSMPGSSVHGIFWQEYWSGLPFPTPGDLPNPGVEPESLTSPALARELFTIVLPQKPIGKLFSLYSS